MTNGPHDLQLHQSLFGDKMYYTTLPTTTQALFSHRIIGGVIKQRKKTDQASASRSQSMSPSVNMVAEKEGFEPSHHLRSLTP